MNVFVIGGGASGIVAAIHAANEFNQVIILERNKECAKKILLTGNGKCNYFNENQELSHYHSSNEDIVKEILTKKNQTKILLFLESIGIIPRIKNGYYYPFSNQATSMKECLLLEAKSRNVEVRQNIIVDEIIKTDGHFIINPKKQNLVADCVVLATGSCSIPKTGSDGIGYFLAKSFGHTIVPVLPALTYLVADQDYFKKCAGIRVMGMVSFYENNCFIKDSFGEIQLTKDGISGICVFNLSGLISRSLKNNNVTIRINFLKELEINTQKDAIEWMNQRNEFVDERTIEELLEGIFPYKLILLFLETAKIPNFATWSNLNEEQKLKLVDVFQSFSITIVRTGTFDTAQVCSGGVSLTEINPQTMESKLVSGLYIVGELLDIDGECGGYNLSNAFITGMLAGLGVNKK